MVSRNDSRGIRPLGFSLLLSPSGLQNLQVELQPLHLFAQEGDLPRALVPDAVRVAIDADLPQEPPSFIDLILAPPLLLARRRALGQKPSTESRAQSQLVRCPGEGRSPSPAASSNENSSTKDRAALKACVSSPSSILITCLSVTHSLTVLRNCHTRRRGAHVNHGMGSPCG